MRRKKINVTLEGLSPMSFDRFWGHSREDIPPERKLYLSEGNVVVLPVQNLKSFLQKEAPPGAIKTVEKRSYGTYIQIAKST